MGMPYRDGTDATGVTPPAGASGIRGWLSGLFNLFNTGTAKVQFNGTQNVATVNGPQAATQGIVNASQVTVGTTSTPIVTGVRNSKQVIIKNNDNAQTLYLGVSGVTTGGFPLGPQQTISFDIIPGSTMNIYGVVASGSIIVGVLELN